MDISLEYYVVVAENDQPHKMLKTTELFYDDGGPLVFEQYLRSADLENIQKRAEQLAKKYGNCRIAKLQFIDPMSIRRSRPVKMIPHESESSPLTKKGIKYLADLKYP